MAQRKTTGHTAKQMVKPAPGIPPQPTSESTPIPLQYKLPGFDFDGACYDQDIVNVLESPQPFYKQGAGQATRIVSVVVAFMRVLLWFGNYRYLESVFFDSVGEAIAWPSGICLRLARRLARARLVFRRRRGNDYKVYFGNGRSFCDLLQRKMVDLIDEYTKLCAHPPSLPRIPQGETVWEYIKPLRLALSRFIETTPQDLPLKPPTVPVQAFIDKGRARSKSPAGTKPTGAEVQEKNINNYRSRSPLLAHEPPSPSNSGLFVGPPPSPKVETQYYVTILEGRDSDHDEKREHRPSSVTSKKENMLPGKSTPPLGKIASTRSAPSTPQTPVDSASRRESEVPAPTAEDTEALRRELDEDIATAKTALTKLQERYMKSAGHSDDVRKHMKSAEICQRVILKSLENSRVALG